MISMVARVACLIVLGVALAGCTGPGIFAPQSGTVTGHVVIRACGGAYRPDQTSCPIRSLPGTRISFQSNGNTVTATADSTGSYRIDLRPGTYMVEVNAERFSRVAGPRQVTVTAGKTITADFTYNLELL